MVEMFQLNKYQTTVRQEILAGIVSFFAASYIIVVNPLILSETGLPPELTVFSTILITAIGCLLMGFKANSPLILGPGMGENAFFAYTMVAALGMTWQESLAAVVVSGLLFFILAYSGLTRIFADSIPVTLKQAITVGIGLFLVLIGLGNSGLVVDGGTASFLILGDLSNPMTLLALVTLFFTAFLFFKKIKGSFLIGIGLMTAVSLITGIHHPEPATFSLSNLSRVPELMTSLDFSELFQIKFILSVLSLTLLVVFETIGMAEGFLEDADRSSEVFKMTSITVILSGILGTSPTVPMAESGSGIKEGGRTGLTAITVGVLFLLSLFFTPLLAYIPTEALGPVLVITGASMMENLKRIPFDDFSEWFPAFLIITMMPFTGSVVNGMAFGFVAYVLLKVLNGQWKQLNTPLVVISILFLMTLFATALI